MHIDYGGSSVTSLAPRRPVTVSLTAEGATPKRTSLRPDIQGLRAVAVVAVILDHLLNWPRGGFVGVDIFFVISGFLITGLLLREYERTGTISFIGFYRRRIKRIIPAATLVVALTVSAGYLVYVGGRSTQIAVDGIWALFFGANWHFAFAGTDYFQAGSALSPLQHYWSLSVEEQFYFVWPWLMLAIFLAAGRSAKWRPEHARSAAALAMCLVIGASFAWGLAETSTSQTQAYFSTYTRTWELGLGALLAALAPRLAALPDRWRPAIAWVGVAAIVAALALTPSDAGFPVPWAIPAVVGTGLVIAAGTGGPVRFRWPPTNRVSGSIGDLSYSLYLWHFPVIVILGAFFAKPTLMFYLVATVVMALGAVGSYHLVENPLRKSTWLVPAAEKDRGERKRRQRQARLTSDLRSNLTWVAALVVILAVVEVAAFYRPVAAARDETAAPIGTEAVATGSDAPADSLVALQGSLRAELIEAVEASAWPDTLTPALESLGEEQFAPEDANGCAEANPDGKDCSAITVRDPSKTIVVVGDSVAVAWLPAVRAAADSAGWEVVALTMVGCPFLDAVSENSDPRVQSACPDHKGAVLDTIARLNPALVVTSSTYRITFADETGAVEEIRESSLRSIVERTKALSGNVVALGAPPVTRNPQECVTRFGGPGDCLSVVPDYWEAQASAEQSAMATVGGLFIPAGAWFCADAQCPVFAGETVIKQDDVHITNAYAQKLAPVLTAALANQGITFG
jgi:peptidoglycan/LPS O-acetylase OafA/YrhL